MKRERFLNVGNFASQQRLCAEFVAGPRRCGDDYPIDCRIRQQSSRMNLPFEHPASAVTNRCNRSGRQDCALRRSIDEKTESDLTPSVRHQLPRFAFRSIPFLFLFSHQARVSISATTARELSLPRGERKLTRRSCRDAHSPDEKKEKEKGYFEMRIAVVGGGHWGSNLIRVFHQLNALGAVCDFSPLRLQQLAATYPDVRMEGSFEALLSDPTIDGVVIATPAETHYDLARKSLLAGKDTYVEKPLTLHCEQAGFSPS